jgi:hypothetical protein
MKYRDGGGGLGHTRQRLRPEREYTVSVVGGEQRSWQRVEAMSLGDIAKELAHIQAKS